MNNMRMVFEQFLKHHSMSLSQHPAAAMGIVFLAGIVAAGVCPCTIPIGLGVASLTSASETQTRREGLKVGLAFFLGIVVNLLLLGALASGLGALLSLSFGRYWALAMAFLSFAAAIVAFVSPRLKVGQLEALRKPGIFGAFSYGFVFSLGTSVSPLLLLLAVTATEKTIGTGLLLPLVFGVGRGLPFLVLSLFANAMTRFTRLSSWRTGISVLSGCALVYVGVYYFRAFLILIS